MSFSQLFISAKILLQIGHILRLQENRILGTHIQYTTEPLSHNESFVFPVFCYVADNPGNGADLLWKA